MSTNQLLTARCSKPVIDMIDKCCAEYGFSRSEIMRTGAINYCQQLLLTSSLEHLLDLTSSIRSKVDDEGLSDEMLKQFDEMERFVNEMQKHLCLK